MTAAAAAYTHVIGFAHTACIILAAFGTAGNRHAVIRHMMELGNAVAGHSFGFFKGRTARLAAGAGAGTIHLDFRQTALAVGIIGTGRDTTLQFCHDTQSFFHQNQNGRHTAAQDSVCLFLRFYAAFKRYSI